MLGLHGVPEGLVLPEPGGHSPAGVLGGSCSLYNVAEKEEPRIGEALGPHLFLFVISGFLWCLNTSTFIRRMGLLRAIESLRYFLGQ